MSEIGPGAGKPESDIYTVLLIIATVFLIAGTVLIGVRAQSQFGSWMPFGP